MSRVKKAVLITFIALLILTILAFGIIWHILNSGYHPEERRIRYDKLSTVMADDIVYLSDEFFTSNKLEIKKLPQLKPPPGIVVEEEAMEVYIHYNRYEVESNPDFNARVENIDSCSYNLQNVENSENIPINIGVGFSPTKLKLREKSKFKKEYNGYKYRLENSIDGKYLNYYIIAQPRNKATCIVGLSFKVEDEVRKEYAEAEINARIEEVFKSAADNIILYDELVRQ